MAGKLTEAQRVLLARMNDGASLSYNRLHGSIWSSDASGSTVKIRAATFNSLSLAGLIAPWGESDGTTGYRITPAGIAALEREKRG